ncbi:hypothetical protein Cob_v001357 [Colletotrichum orbiculare MAFF 240422]|uniref:Uncharacterized protein n=1 Tax=Colletotrichum orbiculare (strain 104-T / ATCC 96160 / CBS 514.97 / LARS 414 / MAFF 240422) TaxID=1213857 RepID=A0A484G6R9_COLOR|nr:hypothetical protein Cob_v001357 [Colletotrichum orbiculare MAFF 240422]
MNFVTNSRDSYKQAHYYLAMKFWLTVVAFAAAAAAAAVGDEERPSRVARDDPSRVLSARQVCCSVDGNKTCKCVANTKEECDKGQCTWVE